jgi:hypothetical protein
MHRDPRDPVRIASALEATSTRGPAATRTAGKVRRGIAARHWIKPDRRSPNQARRLELRREPQEQRVSSMRRLTRASSSRRVVAHERVGQTARSWHRRTRDDPRPRHDGQRSTIEMFPHSRRSSAQWRRDLPAEDGTISPSWYSARSRQIQPRDRWRASTGSTVRDYWVQYRETLSTSSTVSRRRGPAFFRHDELSFRRAPMSEPSAVGRSAASSSARGTSGLVGTRPRCSGGLARSPS